MRFSIDAFRAESLGAGQSSLAYSRKTRKLCGQPEPLKDDSVHADNAAAVKDLIAAIEEKRQPKCSIYEQRGCD